MREIGIAVVTKSFDLANELNQACNVFNQASVNTHTSVIAQVTSLAILDDIIAQNDPDVVIFDPPSIASAELLGIAVGKARANLAAEDKKIILFLFLYASQEGLAALQMQGADAYARPVPHTKEEFYELVASLPGLIQRRTEERQQSKVLPQIDREALMALAQSGWQRLVIGVWSPAKGTGKSLLVRELAFAFSALGKRSTLVIDADTSSAHQDLYLGFTGGNVQADFATVAKLWVANNNTLTPTIVQRALYQHKNYPLYLIPGVRNPVLWRAKELENGPELLKQLILWGRNQYDFVVLDIGHRYFDAVTVAALNSVDRIVVPIVPDVGRIRDLRIAVESLTKSSSTFLQKEKASLVLNMWAQSELINARDLVNYVGIPLITMIPRDISDDVSASINLSRPLVIHYRQSAVAQAIYKVAEVFLPFVGAVQTTAPSEAKKGGKLLNIPLFGKR